MSSDFLKGDKMIDIHSHILPGIDDGAKTNEMAKALLDQMVSQGITSAIATPHFYPDSMDFSEFSQDRQEAYDNLIAFLGEDFPVKIFLGAEVYYFKNMSKFSDVKDLTMPGGKYILLELLGIKEIDDALIKDITDLKENLGITVIIAHTERYYRYKGYKKLFDLFKNKTALCQINSSFTLSFVKTRAVKRLIKEGCVDFIASDCHNPETRPVQMKAGFKKVREISYNEARRIRQFTDDFESELLNL